MIGNLRVWEPLSCAHTLYLTGTRKPEYDSPNVTQQVGSKVNKRRPGWTGFQHLWDAKVGNFLWTGRWLTKGKSSLYNEIIQENVHCVHSGHLWLWHCISVQLQECFHIPQFPARVPTDAALQATKKYLEEACCPHSLVGDLLPL